MRFLADENFPGGAVTVLEAEGHDVVWIRIAAPGLKDRDVLAWAARDRRLLLTFDKDFGELAHISALPAECGILLVRMPMPPASRVGHGLQVLSPAGRTGRGIFRWSNRAVFAFGRVVPGYE